MDIKGIVFFDLDGTLLDNKKNRVPDSALSALKRLREASYKVVVSTGRDMDSHYSVGWRDIVKPDAIIHMNGTKISVGDEIIFEHFMSWDLLERLHKFSEENGICFGTTIGDADYYTDSGKKRISDLSFTNAIRRNFHPFEELISKKIPIHALSYAGDLDAERDFIESRFPELQLLGFDSGRGADVVEKGYSKAEGMKRICGYYGVDEKDTYAFGDSQNDLAIIEAAGVGVAMGNAVPELKAVADHVCGPVWDDGIEKALLKLGIIR